MKLNGFMCDRCGKHYEKNETHDREDRTKQRIIGMALVTTNLNLFRYDLCDECLSQLQDWVVK